MASVRLRITAISGVALALAVGAAWFIEGHVFELPWPLAALVVPAALGSIAFAITLAQLARRGEDGIAVALFVLGSWAVLCPFVVAVLAYVVLRLEPVPPDLAALLAKAGPFYPYSHHVGEAASRAAVSVIGAGWLLVRVLMRRPRASSASGRVGT